MTVHRLHFRSTRLAIGAVLMVVAAGLTAVSLPASCGRGNDELDFRDALKNRAPVTTTRVVLGMAPGLERAAAELARAFALHHATIELAPMVIPRERLVATMRGADGADVYLSDDAAATAILIAEGAAAPADVRVFAANDLVLALPAGSSLELGSVMDLLNPEFARIGVADPDSVSSVARRAMEVLEDAGIADALRDRLVIGATPGAVTEMLRRRELDVAFVLGTDILAEGEHLDGRLVLPHGATVDEVLLLAPDNKGAAEFVAFLESAAGRDVLAALGFRVTAP